MRSTSRTSPQSSSRGAPTPHRPTSAPFAVTAVPSVDFTFSDCSAAAANPIAFSSRAASWVATQSSSTPVTSIVSTRSATDSGMQRHLRRLPHASLARRGSHSAGSDADALSAAQGLPSPPPAPSYASSSSSSVLKPLSRWCGASAARAARAAHTDGDAASPLFGTPALLHGTNVWFSRESPSRLGRLAKRLHLFVLRFHTCLLCTLVALVFACSGWLVVQLHHPPSVGMMTPTEYLEYLPPPASPLAVAVAASGVARAPRRGQKAELQTTDAGTAAAVPVLPSWTLRVVEPTCTECLDADSYHNATDGEDLRGTAVFATPSAPLGLIGPMLFAMASVTDDVDVAAELAHWPWVTRSYAMQREYAAAVALDTRPLPASSYLVVMGIPSTDQPVRTTMREAQRATWLTYREAARSANAFAGALLPLYIFAAAERPPEDAGLHTEVDLTQLFPTFAEVGSTTPQTQEGERADQAAVAEPHYERRRVALRERWRNPGASAQLLADSPCTSVRTTAVAAAQPNTSASVAALAAALSLPVTPAYVAPATYVCHASTALWQEALRRRDCLWVNMLTDRRPTTAKKLGGTTDWGLPVEVGMSQKTILWLIYAYTAFPEVPYIMKGDDDSYLKVPQLLSDLRHLRDGWDRPRKGRPTTSQSQPEAAAGRQGETRRARGGADAEAGAVELTSGVGGECVYMGSTLNRSDVPYQGGSGYLIHRRVAQAVLEHTHDVNRLAVRLATLEFNAAWEVMYKSIIMQYEDFMVGRMIQDNHHRIAELCPRRRLWFVADLERRRFHDAHRGLFNYVRAHSLLVHRCTPADQLFLDHFFRTEFSVAAAAAPILLQSSASAEVYMSMEAAEESRGRQWVRDNVLANTLGINQAPPEAWWLQDPNASVPYTMAPAGDGTAVYLYEYKPRKWQHAEWAIEVAMPDAQHPPQVFELQPPSSRWWIVRAYRRLRGR